MTSERRIADIDAQHEQSRNRVLAAISGEDNSEAATLVRWMFENDVNPYDVFSSYSYASLFSTFEGISGVMHIISHALHDDGDISFVKTNNGDARICFLPHDIPDFEKHFMADAKRSFGNNHRAIKAIKPIGFIGIGDNPREEMLTFISTKNDYANKMKELFEKSRRRMAEMSMTEP